MRKILSKLMGCSYNLGNFDINYNSWMNKAYHDLNSQLGY